MYPLDLPDRYRAWRLLTAWDKPLPEALPNFSYAGGVSSYGMACQVDLGDCNVGWEVHVECGSDPADGYATLLHEMAHLASWADDGHHHSPVWRARYLDAVEEVTGVRPAVTDWTWRGVDRACTQAFAHPRSKEYVP